MFHNPRIIVALRQHLKRLNKKTLDEINPEMRRIVNSNTFQQTSTKKVKLPWIDNQILFKIEKRILLYDNAKERNLNQNEQTRRSELYRIQKHKVITLIRHREIENLLKIVKLNSFNANIMQISCR